MNQTFSERRSLFVPMHWLHAGGDLFRTDLHDQCFERPLIRFEHPPKCRSQAPELTGAQTCTSSLVTVAPAFKGDDNIKSP